MKLMRISKKQLAETVQVFTGASYHVSYQLVKDLLGDIVSACELGHIVQLNGFGTFRQVTRKPGKRRVPKTGEIVECEDYQTLNFKPSKALRRPK